MEARIDALIGLLLFVLCGVASAVLYREKNRSRFAGFSIGFLGGPLGLLFAVTMPRFEEQPD